MNYYLRRANLKNKRGDYVTGAENIISIIIPVYNTQKYISECLDSVINQTVKDWRVILINDGSTDNSLSVCEHYAAADDRIILINKKNSGVSDSRNVGINASDGDFIVFLDSDDRIHPNMLEKLREKMISENSDICVCGFSKFDENNKTVKWSAPDGSWRGDDFFNIFGKLYDMTLLSGPCFKMYRSNIIKENNILFDVNRSLGEDLTFNLQYYAYCNSLCCVSEPMYEYRTVKNTSLSNKFNPQKSEIQYELYNQVVDFCRMHGSLDNNLPYINKVFFRQTYTQIQSIFYSKISYSSKKKTVNDVLDKYMTDEFLSSLTDLSKHNKLVISLMRRRSIVGLFMLIKIKDIINKIR